ncbi:hypothetical protein Ancab_007492, partial [Ancistrocladus abbreviatus]
VGSWDAAGKIRRKMKLRIEKTPWISSIEFEDNIHDFVAGYISHIVTESIYAMLETLPLKRRIHE